MKVIPLTVLVYEGPMARAYLAVMYEAGIQPQRIIQMVLDHHPGTKKPIPRWLPKGLRLRLAAKIQDMSLYYWSRSLVAQWPDLMAKMAESIGDHMDVPDRVFDAVLGKEPLTTYCKDVSQMLVSGYNDPMLKKKLHELGSGALLYTGGGIVPKDLLDLPGLKVLHVHPGFLPDVKGSDGLLWSLISRSRLAASCFYMEPNIDTGQIILAREFDAVTFPLSAVERPEDMTLYRALFSLYDPILRAKVLQETLKLVDDPAEFEATPQTVTEGITFHFMHPSVRKAALKKLFPMSHR